MNWRERITVDPLVCKRRACVKGTRVLASVVLDNLAANRTAEEIMRSYPRSPAWTFRRAWPTPPTSPMRKSCHWPRPRHEVQD
jgi:uncharacterized protein (DUF433 family)